MPEKNVPVPTIYNVSGASESCLETHPCNHCAQNNRHPDAKVVDDVDLVGIESVLICTRPDTQPVVLERSNDFSTDERSKDEEPKPRATKRPVLSAIHHLQTAITYFT
jgi:hypothetical protein